ncbi:MAG TPA: hypothetical protein VLA62_00465, partial [Solirubrobacterales bacterium]|nr:hypothetical protein [Solirubrobacterales bacterium]
SGVALSALVAVTWLPRTQGPLDLRWDSGAYYVLATSLAEGKGYRLLNEPGEIEAIQYPPGLPALVALHQVLLGTSDPHVVGRWLRLTFFVMAVGYAVAAFALLRRFFTVRLAGLGTLLCVLTPGALITNDALVAEVPFVLAVTLFALFALRTGRAAPLLAGLCAVVAYLFRAAGTAVLLAWVADSAVRRQWRSLAVRLLVAAIPVLAWHGHIARVERDPGYARPAYAYQRAPYLFNNVSYATNIRLKDPFRPALGMASIPEAAWRSVRNLPSLPSALGEVVSTDRRSWELVFAPARLPSLVGRRVPALMVETVLVGLGTLALVGIAVLVRRREHLVSLLLFATVLAACSTPWAGQWARYLSPIAPLVMLAAIEG